MGGLGVFTLISESPRARQQPIGLQTLNHLEGGRIDTCMELRESINIKVGNERPGSARGRDVFFGEVGRNLETCWCRSAATGNAHKVEKN